ncbi:MAG: LysE family transporter [bacterium]
MSVKLRTIFKKGLVTGLALQFAIGPVFFFITNLVLQRTFWDGFVAVCAVTLVDYFYITLSILGIGKILENKKAKKPLGIISSLVLVLFGLLMLKAIIVNFDGIQLGTVPSDLISSFTSTFVLTISSPLTIVFFTGIFAAKAMENNFSKKELFSFGLGTGFATLIFMGSAIIFFFVIKTAVPLLLIQFLNALVGILLVSYGVFRFVKVLRNN